MTDNNTDGAALLPVTQGDGDLTLALIDSLECSTDAPDAPEWAAKFREELADRGFVIARHATQEDAERPCIDYWNEVAQRLGHESVCEALEKLAELQEDAERSVAGGWASMKDAEAQVMRDWQLGNLTKLGVANHLRHAGFDIRYATDKANALSTPAMSDLQRLGQEYDGEAVREALALRLAAAHDEISGSPTRAVVAIKAGVDMCRDYWLHIADAALAHPAQAPEQEGDLLDEIARLREDVARLEMERALSPAQTVDETGGLVEALGKAIVFSAYRASDPLAIRFEFANDDDRVAAADAVDEAFLLGAHGIREGEER